MRRSPFFILSLLLPIMGGILLTLGATPWGVALEGAWSRWHGEAGWNCLLDERLPRMLVLGMTGASLATSGAVTQSLFRNPLASPSVLGIPFGGAFCVLLVLIYGWQQRYPMAIPLAAAGGSFVMLLLVTALSTREGRLDLSLLVLNGIALTTLLLAAQKVLLYTLRDQWSLIQTVTEWEAGNSADRTWNHVRMQLPLTLVGLSGLLYYRRELNILTMGEEEALTLGVDVEKVRTYLFLFVALLAGGSLAAVGNIAFFGLLLPYLLRKVWGCDNRTLLPLAAVAGANLMLILEITLRVTGTTLFTIGNISSLLGGCCFMLLLLQQRRNMQLVW